MCKNNAVHYILSLYHCFDAVITLRHYAFTIFTNFFLCKSKNNSGNFTIAQGYMGSLGIFLISYFYHEVDLQLTVNCFSRLIKSLYHESL